MNEITKNKKDKPISKLFNGYQFTFAQEMLKHDITHEQHIENILYKLELTNEVNGNYHIVVTHYEKKQLKYHWKNSEWFQKRFKRYMKYNWYERGMVFEPLTIEGVIDKWYQNIFREWADYKLKGETMDTAHIKLNVNGKSKYIFVSFDEDGNRKDKEITKEEYDKAPIHYGSSGATYNFW